MPNSKHYKYVEFITNRFKDQEVHVVGSGPSMAGFDYSVFNGHIVIAVNHTYKLIKNPNCVVFVDIGFAYRELPKIAECPEIVESGLPMVSRFNKELPQIHSFDFSSRFNYDPANGVYQRRSSGLIAVCIALQGGAKKVYMHGFDYRGANRQQIIEIVQKNGGNIDSLKDFNYYLHATTGEFNHSREGKSHEILFSQNVIMFRPMPKDKIINCSQFSALDQFPRMDYRDVLKPKQKKIKKESKTVLPKILGDDES